MKDAVMVIVPAYNEAPVIRQTLEGLLAAGYAVVLVDDASTDGTSTVVADLALHRLRHPVNLGQGAALQTGMAYAKAQGAQYVLHFDADGQHRVADLPRLLAPLQAGDADVVLGSRFLDALAQQQVPKRRRWLLRLAVWVNWLFTGLRLTDAHNGLRALGPKALACLELRENRMAHATEVLAEIKRHRLRYQEVPVTIDYPAYARQKGQTAWSAVGILTDLIWQKITPR